MRRLKQIRIGLLNQQQPKKKKRGKKRRSHLSLAGRSGGHARAEPSDPVITFVLNLRMDQAASMLFRSSLWSSPEPYRNAADLWLPRLALPPRRFSLVASNPSARPLQGQI
jgi:hypothetical protein